MEKCVNASVCALTLAAKHPIITHVECAQSQECFNCTGASVSTGTGASVSTGNGTSALVSTSTGASASVSTGTGTSRARSVIVCHLLSVHSNSTRILLLVLVLVRVRTHVHIAIVTAGNGTIWAC